MAQRAHDDPRCKDCPADREPDRSRCAECAERHRKEASKVAKARRKAGLCVTCGAPVAKRARDGKRGTLCAEHAAYYLARVTPPA